VTVAGGGGLGPPVGLTRGPFGSLFIGGEACIGIKRQSLKIIIYMKNKLMR
jgi:hypothetical protein